MRRTHSVLRVVIEVNLSRVIPGGKLLSERSLFNDGEKKSFVVLVVKREVKREVEREVKREVKREIKREVKREVKGGRERSLLTGFGEEEG